MRSLLPQIGNEVVLQDGHRWASYYRSACSVPCATCGVAGIVGIVLRASLEGTCCVALIA